MKSYRPPWLGEKWFDVFKTSPGRIDPRTGRLMELAPVAVSRPWEREEAPSRPPERRGEGRREWESRSLYPRMRPEFAGMASRLGQNAEESGFWGSIIPWLFIGGVALVVIEAVGAGRPKTS